MTPLPGNRPADVQAAFAATLVDEWVRAGVTDAVVAPGSRSTPVLAALAADGRIRLHVVLDERSAGFVALGLGLATARPAPVVTTSGTAAVELHPAVVEAHQARVPMLAVTADRPSELHHVGAPQTIEQEQLFAGATRWAVSPGVADVASVFSWRSLASRSVAAAVSSPAGPGPVHLNLAWREPLLGDASEATVPAGRPGGAPWHSVTAPNSSAAEVAVVESLLRFAGRRGLIVVGGGSAAPGEGEAVVELAHQLGWVVFADPRSEARFADPAVVGAFDALLRSPVVKGWQPELVLRVGQLPASKVLTQWLAALPADIPQILLDPDGTWSDPDRRVAVVSPASVVALTEAVGARIEPLPPVSAADAPSGPGSWPAAWAQAEAEAQTAMDGHLFPNPELNEPALARTVHAALPDGSVLAVSSSMPVRDVEWFAAPRRGVRVVANRGANGIDGVVSTALGVALAGSPTVALLGDLAFAYDVSALLWATGRDIDLTLVVVDNDGGGIFSFLPQATALAPERFERFWGTPHGLDLLAIAQAYGVEVGDVTSPEALRKALAVVGTGRGVRVLRVATDRATNVRDHAAIEAAVAAAVAGLTLAQ
jgi:2-succinyl-5-enolpyruvyl-6-hydroxy-3-cyclohexene-1-carboxylate synthase